MPPCRRQRRKRRDWQRKSARGRSTKSGGLSTQTPELAEVAERRWHEALAKVAAMRQCSPREVDDAPRKRGRPRKSEEEKAATAEIRKLRHMRRDVTGGVSLQLKLSKNKLDCSKTRVCVGARFCCCVWAVLSMCWLWRFRAAPVSEHIACGVLRGPRHRCDTMFLSVRNIVASLR